MTHHRGDRIVIDDPGYSGPPLSDEQLAEIAAFEAEARRMIGRSIRRAHFREAFKGALGFALAYAVRAIARAGRRRKLRSIRSPARIVAGNSGRRASPRSSEH